MFVSLGLIFSLQDSHELFDDLAQILIFYLFERLLSLSEDRRSAFF